MLRLGHLMSILFPLLLLTACEDREFSVYTQSLTRSSSSGRVENLNVSILKGTYQILRPSVLGPSDYVLGLLKIQASCFGIGGWRIDAKADCKSSERGPFDLLKVANLIRVQDRLFLEIKVADFAWGRNYRYSLVEVVIAPDRLLLVPMGFDKELLLKSTLNFHRHTTSGRVVFEVSNDPTDAIRLLEIMRPASHQSPFRKFEIRDIYNGDRFLQFAMEKGIRIREIAKGYGNCEESIADTPSSVSLEI